MDYTQLPSHLLRSISDYVEFGQPQGHFIQALLCNDLKGVAERADEYNAPLIHLWVKYLYNHIPMGAWGSKESYDNWVKMGGLKGSNY